VTRRGGLFYLASQCHPCFDRQANTSNGLECLRDIKCHSSPTPRKFNEHGYPVSPTKLVVEGGIGEGSQPEDNQFSRARL